jgi:hypothetical protein
VRADVADGAQGTTVFGLEPPVPVRVEQQPILEIVAGDEPHVADRVAGDHLAQVLVDRVEADVEVHSGDSVRGIRDPDELCGLRGRHGERLLADDVPAGGQDGLDLRVVEVVRRRDVDDLDPAVVENLIEAGVRRGHAQLVRACRRAVLARAKHTVNLDADPAQPFDVDGADEPAADDGSSDVTETPHSGRLLHWHGLNDAEPRRTITSVTFG